MTIKQSEEEPEKKRGKPNNCEICGESGKVIRATGGKNPPYVHIYCAIKSKEGQETKAKIGGGDKASDEEESEEESLFFNYQILLKNEEIERELLENSRESIPIYALKADEVAEYTEKVIAAVEEGAAIYRDEVSKKKKKYNDKFVRKIMNTVL